MKTKTGQHLQPSSRGLTPKVHTDLAETPFYVVADRQGTILANGMTWREARETAEERDPEGIEGLMVMSERDYEEYFRTHPLPDPKHQLPSHFTGDPEKRTIMTVEQKKKK